MLDTNTRACAAAVRWLRDALYSEVETDEAAFAAVDADAAEVPAGAEGLLFHPYLMGEDAPYWDPHLRASFQGLHVVHGRPHLARAVLEGTAFALRDAMSTLGRWSEGFERTVFTGGGTLSPTWLSIVADVLGRDGEVAETADASLGAAMLAGVGTGVFADLEASLERCYRVRQRVAHDAARAAVYDRLFEQYLQSRPDPRATST
jgi:xylulokinase